MDSPSVSQQEVANRAILSEIAKAKNIRFALPRANMECPTQAGSTCWGWRFDEAELSVIVPKILDSRSACFTKEKPFIILGFSNGGYLLTRWYSSGAKPTMSSLLRALIVSGAGRGQVAANIQTLSKNPPLTMMIGQQDEFNFDGDETFFKELKSRGAPVQLLEFRGGHQLNKNMILKSLSDSNGPTK